MSRLDIKTPSKAQMVVEHLYRSMEHRIEASPPGLCPIDMALNFLNLCHAQTCGKCVPCRIGLKQLMLLIQDVLDGKATMDTLKLMEETALAVMEAADCAIGYEAANMVYKGLTGYRDEYIEHIVDKKCAAHVCKSMRVYEIDPDKCKGCTKCARNCPVGAISGVPGQKPYVIDHDKCIKCGACMEKCKFKAVSTR